MALSSFFLLYLLVLATVALAQIPCDDAYGQYCPEELGWKVGDCLKQQTSLPPRCLDFIKLSDTCKSDIEKYCVAKEYTGDLLPCLTEWTKPADLSAECLAALPKKEAPKEKVLSKEDQKKAAKRRSRRKNAAKIAREF